LSEIIKGERGGEVKIIGLQELARRRSNRTRMIGCDVLRENQIALPFNPQAIGVEQCE